MPETLFECREEMRSLIPPGDTEAAHSRADDLLIEGLRALKHGLPQIWHDEIEDLISSWKAIKKWYA